MSHFFCRVRRAGFCEVWCVVGPGFAGFGVWPSQIMPSFARSDLWPGRAALSRFIRGNTYPFAFSSHALLHDPRQSTCPDVCGPGRVFPGLGFAGFSRAGFCRVLTLRCAGSSVPGCARRIAVRAVSCRYWRMRNQAGPVRVCPGWPGRAGWWSPCSRAGPRDIPNPFLAPD